MNDLNTDRNMKYKVQAYVCWLLEKSQKYEEAYVYWQETSQFHAEMDSNLDQVKNSLGHAEHAKMIRRNELVFTDLLRLRRVPAAAFEGRCLWQKAK